MARKAQAAMEFLMTYGWAILVVLVAIGALVYFGVFDIQKTLPDQCEFGPGLGCVDYHMSDGEAVLVVQNTLSREITITELSFTKKGEDVAFCSSNFAPVVVTSGATASIACSGQLDISGKERFEPTVKFKLNDVGFEFTGDIFTTPKPAGDEVQEELAPVPPPLKEVMPPPEEIPPPEEEVIPPPEEAPLVPEEFIPPPEETPLECIPESSTEDPYTMCTDELDNDCDGMIDCSDSDCFVGEDCPAPPMEKAPEKTAESICDNEIDDDSDDYIDCQDTDCINDPACTQTEILCADELDNDGDKLIDCSDLDCAGTKVCP